MNNLWTEKYRPKKIEDIVLPQSVKNGFKQTEMPILLHGTPGCGKTTYAKIIAMGRDAKFINCSVENSIDDLKEDLIRFCSTASLLNDTLKVVILDEFEGVSESYFKALRGVMETFSKTTTFIATTNYINKIPESIQSRFEKIHFYFTASEEKEVKNGYYKRLQYICQKEGLTITKDALISLIEQTYPDLRSAILKLQAFYQKGITDISIDNVHKSLSIFSDLFDLLFTSKNDADLFSHTFKEYSHIIDEVFFSLGREFPKYLIEKGKPNLIGDVCLIVQKYSYESKFSIDRCLSLWCCIYSLKELVKK